MIYAPNDNVTISNNAFWRPSVYCTPDFVLGGAVNTDAIIGDPKFIDRGNQNFALNAVPLVSIRDQLQRSTMTDMVPVMTSECLAGTISSPMGDHQ